MHAGNGSCMISNESSRRAQASTKAADPAKFLPHAKMVEIPLNNSCFWVVIQITTETEQFVAGESSHPSNKFVRICRKFLDFSAKFDELPLSYEDKNFLKFFSRSGSRPERLPKFTGVFLVQRYISVEIFMRILSVVFIWWCKQTDKQTNVRSLAEVIMQEVMQS